MNIHYRKQIIKIINEELNRIKPINEYLTNDGVYLLQYFKQTDEQKIQSLPYMYPWHFDTFVDELDVDIDTSNYDGNPHEYIEELEQNNKEIFTQFGEYLFKKIEESKLEEPFSEYPAWSFFDNNPQVIKNQWLIHFTYNAHDIAVEGFTKGVSEIDKLGLTTHLSEFKKKYGGYNFAYLIKDFSRYGMSNNSFGGKYKYGNEAVIFNASGVRLYHYGDEEPQVIFYGNTAKNIIPITKGEETDWAVYSNKTGRVLYENDDLQKVVSWIVLNYSQYRKQLVGAN